MTNQTLTYLDLSENEMGPDVGMALGHVLRSNESLTTLNVNNNLLSARPVLHTLHYLINLQRCKCHC